MVTSIKCDPPDYSVSGESPLGSCHRGGTFESILVCGRSVVNRGPTGEPVSDY